MMAETSTRSAYRHIFQARTFYIAAGLWFLALLLYVGLAPNPPAGSKTSLILLIVIGLSFWGPIVFAIWQGVHWALSRPARKIERDLGFEEDQAPAESIGSLPAPLAVLSVGDVRKPANYRTLKTALGRASVFSFTFGGLAIFTAFRTPDSLSLVVMFAAAALLIQHGLWLRRTLNPIGLITGGVTMIALGLWTLAVGVNTESPGSASSALPAVGIWQLVWGAGVLRRFDDMRLRRLGRYEPDQGALDALDRVAMELSFEHKSSGGGIVFTATNWAHTFRLIGRLTPRIAIFVTERGDDVFVGGSSDTSITPLEAVGSDRDFKASLKIGDDSFKGTCSPHSFERYQFWKSHSVT